MNKTYYAEYFHYERKNWWFQVRYQIIDHFITRYKTKDANDRLKILNIGAATGHSTEVLMKHGDVKSLEYDAECCEFTRKALAIDIVHGSITELPFNDNAFDIVCAFDVIEHIENDQRAVSEIARVCKPGGLTFITVPAFMSLWSPHDEVNFHFRRYRKSQILKLFQNQFQRIHSTYFNTFLFPPIFLFRAVTRAFPNFRRKKAGSDFSVIPENSFINKILYSLFKIESLMLRVVNYPFGVSYFYAGRKQ